MTTWDNANSGDGIGSRQAVEELLRSVERVAPMHPGMHHYRIHLWDGVKQEMAVKSAELYAAAVPNIAHAWHMPGHTFTGLKRYDDAAYQQEGSARVDHAAMSRDRIMPFEIHNYAHNNQWLATSLSHAGRPHLAIQVARNLVVQPRDPAKNNKTDGGSAQRSGRSRWSEVLVRYELWDDLIDATNSGDLDWSDLPAEQRDKHYNLGIAYAWKGDNSNARAQVDALKAMAPREEKAEEKKDEQKDGKRERTIDTKSQVAEIEAIVLLNEGKTDEALKRLDDANSMRPEAKARFQLRAGKSELALSNINKTVSSHTNEVPPLACQVELLHAAGKDAEAKDAYARLLALNDLSEAGVPVYDRLRAIASAWSAAGWQAHAAEKPATTGPNRIDLTMLGPLCWAPVQAEPIVLNDSDGKPWNLSEHHGRTVVALFYLGGKCAHCVQQLEAFGKDYEAFKAMGVDIVAIGTDDQATAQGLKSNTDGIKFPMPLLIDSGLRTFKAYRAYDDFEDQPLHGTFLIDSQGGVRFQNISYTPLMDVAFVKQEAERVTQLLRNNQRPGAVARQGCQP
jgi:peroxiredoxin/tetratricopeptide (TPR) repeat protein